MFKQNKSTKHVFNVEEFINKTNKSRILQNDKGIYKIWMFHYIRSRDENHEEFNNWFRALMKSSELSTNFTNI